MNDRVLTEIDGGGHAAVTLNRPGAHNAFDPEMVEALASALARLEADPEVRSVSLRGAGKNFCAGADIAHMKESAGFSSERNFQAAHKTAAMLHRLYTLGKPTIACVRGAARGGGVGLVAACDIAIASRDATFRLSEVKLGIIPAMISPYVIAAMGERMARRYMLGGDEFDARTARDIGLVHEVVDEGDLDDRISKLLASLRTSGPRAMAAIKKLVPLSAHAAIDASMVDETARRIAEIRATPEAREGLSAFLEKRSPAWAGSGRRAGEGQEIATAKPPRPR